MEVQPREAWKARPPKSRKAIGPTEHLFLHHTVTNPPHNHAAVRNIQNFHMDGRGWSDIAYSFLVTNGVIYEGRGGLAAGAHTEGYNSISHAIAVMGNYEVNRPTDALLQTIAECVAYGYKKGWWPDHITQGHQEAKGAQTQCPGKYLMAEIPTINKMAQEILGSGSSNGELVMDAEVKAVLDRLEGKIDNVQDTAEKAHGAAMVAVQNGNQHYGSLRGWAYAIAATIAPKFGTTIEAIRNKAHQNDTSIKDGK